MDSNNHPKPHPPIKKLSAEVRLDEQTATADILASLEARVFGETSPEEKPSEEATHPIPAGEYVPAPTEKKPYVLKEHLTERPFKHHEGLQQLKESIDQPSARYSGKNRSSSKGRK
jgi:hypothetical protein